MKTIFKIAICALFISTTACKKDKKDPDASTVNQEQLLTDFTTHIALKTYSDMENKASELESAINALQADKSQNNLLSAQEKWRAMRQPWEQSEAFLFGKVASDGLDPAIDTWPMDINALDSLINSSTTLDYAGVDALPENLKGFHPLEYLLFGASGNRQVGQLSARHYEYMLGLTQQIKNTASAIKKSWDKNEPDNYAIELINAGKGSTLYTSKRQAYIEILDAMIGIAEEVADGKMEEPYVAQDSLLEESGFSKNSLTDFKNNMIGIQNVYFGYYDANQKGIALRDLVLEHNRSLDVKINNAINNAIASLQNFDKPYGKAIFEEEAKIIAAQNAIRELQTVLDEELRNLINQKVQ